MKTIYILTLSKLWFISLMLLIVISCKKEPQEEEQINETPKILNETTPSSCKINTEVFFIILFDPSVNQKSLQKVNGGKLIDGNGYFNIATNFKTDEGTMVIDYENTSGSEYGNDGKYWTILMPTYAKNYGIRWKAKFFKPGNYTFSLEITNYLHTIRKTYSIQVDANFNFSILPESILMGDSLQTKKVQIKNTDDIDFTLFLGTDDKSLTVYPTSLSLKKTESKEITITLKKSIAYTGEHSKNLLVNWVNDFSGNVIRKIPVNYTIPDSANIELVDYNPQLNIFCYEPNATFQTSIKIRKTGFGTAKFNILKFSDLIEVSNQADWTSTIGTGNFPVKINTSKLPPSSDGGILIDSIKIVTNRNITYTFSVRIYNYAIYGNLCTGGNLEAAGEYTAGKGLHPIIFKGNNHLFPETWNPRTLAEAELFVCMSKKAESVQTCNYTGGKQIVRYRYYYDVTLNRIKSGSKVTSFKIYGSDPSTCPSSATFQQNETVRYYYGGNPDIESVISRLSSYAETK